MSNNIKNNGICCTEKGIIIVIIPRILIGIQELNHRTLEWTGTKVVLGISLVSPLHVYLLLFASFWFIFTQLASSQSQLPHHDHCRPICMGLVSTSSLSLHSNSYERGKIWPAQCLFASCTTQVTSCSQLICCLLLDQVCFRWLGPRDWLGLSDGSVSLVCGLLPSQQTMGRASPQSGWRKTTRYTSYYM